MGYRRENVYPLEQLPEEMQADIYFAVQQPDPPKRWIRIGLAEIESRAWWEWHWQRGVDPEKRRPSLSSDIRRMVIARDGLVCGLCGGEVETAKDVHIDHIIPVSRGGTNVLGNLQVAHARCNMRKGARG